MKKTSAKNVARTPYEQGRQHYRDGYTTLETAWCPWNSPSHEGAYFWAGFYAAQREDQEAKK